MIRCQSSTGISMICQTCVAYSCTSYVNQYTQYYCAYKNSAANVVARGCPIMQTRLPLKPPAVGMRLDFKLHEDGTVYYYSLFQKAVTHYHTYPFVEGSSRLTSRITCATKGIYVNCWQFYVYMHVAYSSM